MEISGSPLKSHTRTGAKHAISDVRLLAPILPVKVLAVGLNYASHAGMSGARQPEIFWKASSAIVGPGDAIWYPPGADSVHYEGELVAVIGKRARDVPADKALEYVFGVTAGNDVSERGWQGGGWVRADRALYRHRIECR